MIYQKDFNTVCWLNGLLYWAYTRICQIWQFKRTTVCFHLNFWSVQRERSLYSLSVQIGRTKNRQRQPGYVSLPF